MPWAFDKSNDRLRISYETNETHIWSTMTVINTIARDTGYYSCEKFFAFADIISHASYKKSIRNKYVYFYGL